MIDEASGVLAQLMAREANVSFESCLEVLRFYGSENVFNCNLGVAFGDPFGTMAAENGVIGFENELKALMTSPNGHVLVQFFSHYFSHFYVSTGHL